jgi:hypothetical protein
MNSPSEEADSDLFSDISSYLSPTSSTHIFDSPTRNSDTLNFGAASGSEITENDFNFNNGNIDDTPPLSPSRDRHGDTASTSMEYHPYLNGKMNSNL